MKLILSNLCTFLILILSNSIVNSATYRMSELVATPLDVPDVVNTVVWDNTDTNYPDDDDKQTVNIGFPFQFADTVYTDLTIFTNGILKFGTIERMHRDYRNEALDTNEGDRFIAVYWDDVEEVSGSAVTYGVSGVAPNRKFIVNWENVKAYSSSLRYDFQAVLYENGDIRYRYDNNTANGESATIGLEVDDSDFTQYSYNQISVEVSFDLLFRNELLALPQSIAQYRFDETSWNGGIGEVIDSSVNKLHGRAYSGANTSDVTPVFGDNIGTCNYGEFNGTSDYVEIADNNRFDFDTDFSVGTWIKINSIPASGLKTILSKDENYEFHVDNNGNINWWWRTAITNSIREITSTVAISPGVWTHVAISYKRGSQKIFINGIESATSTYISDARNNSDPIQIGADQNEASRYFNGDIDEVNIFDQALTSLQVLELMELTRPCSSRNLCLTSFPDGLNSHNNGTITFGLDAQLFFSPDDILDASSIVLDGTSSDRSCVAEECLANGLVSDITTPPSFPSTAGFTNDMTIGNNGSGVTDPSINQYNEIDIGNGSVFTISTSYNDYYIDILSVGNNTELELLPGNYWIRNLDTGATNNPNSGLEIRVIGSGTARIYIHDDVILGQSLLANSVSQGSEGDPSKLMLYSYSNILIERDSTFSGIIYAAGDVELERDNNVYGAIAGGNISLGRLTNVFYDPNAAVDLDFGNLCQSLSCTLGSFNIIQPSYALACPGTRTQISIQAMCDDGTSIKDDYVGTVDLTSSENSLSEFYQSPITAATINSIIFDGSESGLKEVYLFHQNENPALQVIASDLSTPISSTSTNPTDYRSTGFSVTEPTSFTCGASSNMTLTAIGEDNTGATCQILTGFTGIKAVKAWYAVNVDSDPAAEIVTTNLSVAGQLISDQAEPGANNVNLAFTNGVADIPLMYANAGQISAVNFKHDDAPYDNSVPELAGINLSGNTSSFIAIPEKINLSINDANSTCAAGDASCTRFKKAGEEFSVIAEALCIGGGLADDYQGEIELTHSLVAPLSGRLGDLSVANAIIAAVDGGSIEISNQSISEVGVFNLISTDKGYFGQTIPTDTLSNVGRFYPAQFTMLAGSSMTNACADFSYMGQTAGLSYTLEAQNTGNIKTQNYHGNFVKMNPASDIDLVAENANDGGGYQARLLGFGSTNWNRGEYLLGTTGNFSRAVAPDGPFQTLQVGIQISDNDGGLTLLSGLDMKADANTDCGALGNCDAKLIGDLDVRFGQLKLSNVFGPEAFDLDMAVRTEYFDGTGFILNTDDSCTSLVITDPPFTPSNWTDNLADGDSAISLNSDITAGLGVIRFGAAGLGNEGSVIFNYRADSWLKTENTGVLSYDDDAVGKVTFGQFRGNDRMIYWREIVR